jgi:tRNA(fMet)-specific endonuclease VapC
MPRLMLDTNHCIYIMKREPSEVVRQFERITPGSIAISSLVVAELCYGIAKSRNKLLSEKALGDFLTYLPSLSWPREAAPIYGELRAKLERIGRPIGSMDMLIAAHALYEDATLITNNRAEFARVAGLRLENWIRS